MGTKQVYETAKANAKAKKERLTLDGLKEARREVAMTKKMSGGMAIGGGKKNYKATGTISAKTGKLVGGQKNLPGHLKKAILA